ncbi:MAG: ABC transporter substrate-binding protein [Firmicutes bacterium]|nr:ABC transporter substrate-binding protein [Bacillota bacterium]
MKATLRKASVVLVIMLVAALVFTACNRDGGTEPTTQVTQAEQPPPPPPAPADDVEAAPPTEDEAVRLGGIHPPKDMGGRTLRVGCWWENALSFAIMGWDEPDPATAGNYFIDRMVWENGRRVYEEFNFVIEDVVLEHDQMVPMLTASVMAGDPFADIVMLGGGMQLTAFLGDLILPAQRINLPNSDVHGPQLYGHLLNPFGGEYLAVFPNQPFLDAMLMGVNMDIINAIGAPNPQELYVQGRWTWDAALEIMRMATRDTTGDGIIDQFGIAGQPGEIINLFIGSNDGRLVTDDNMYYLDHPNTVAALEFMEIIFREGLWEYDRVHGFDVGNWGVNFWAWHEGNSAFAPMTTWSMNNGDLPFDFIGVPFPLGPGNTSGNSTMGGYRQSWTFPHGSDWDPADILMILEEFWSWPGDEPDLMPDNELGWPRGVWLTEDCVQNQLNAGFRMTRCIGMVVPRYNWIFGSFVNHFANQEMTAMQAIEHHRGPQQEILDEYLRR